MKNLNKRTKTLLAIAGLVIVVVVAGLVVLGPSTGLFGGDVIHISPQNPTINVGDQLDMSINSVGSCTWSSTDPGIVHIDIFQPDYSRKITVSGQAPGQVTIKANCWMNRYTTVTVRTPPVVVPSTATLRVGETATFTTDSHDPTCHWSMTATTYSYYAYIPSGNDTVGASVTVLGSKPGGIARVKAWGCANGSATATINVQ